MLLIQYLQNDRIHIMTLIISQKSFTKTPVAAYVHGNLPIYCLQFISQKPFYLMNESTSADLNLISHIAENTTDAS